MPDHLHEYNIEVKAARLAYREAMNAAVADYEAAVAPLLAAQDTALDMAAYAYKAAMIKAEDTYNQAVADDDDEPPF